MWADADHPLRLIQRPIPPKTPDKAVSCFGALCQELGDIFLDFAPGYPDSEQMWWFIIKLLQLARQHGRKVWVLIWDNAPWHTSKRIREWIRLYNLAAKAVGEVRLLVFWLPRKSPWLNPIEPHWGHAKKHICEPSGDLATPELKRRVIAYFANRPSDPSFKPLAPN
jgi:transposase